MTRIMIRYKERLGFHPFAPDEPDQFDLYLLTSETDATLRRIR